jgi:hypothetical protein
VEWEAARESLAYRGQALRDRLGVISIPAFDPVNVPERWETTGLTGRRAILSAVFERIEVHRATTTLYDPQRIELVWRLAGPDEPVASRRPIHMASDTACLSESSARPTVG